MNTLEEYRNGSQHLHHVAYKAARSEDRGSYDANEKQRFSLLVELQYDFKVSDYQLIRFLFEQETIAREKDSFQGVGHALYLAGYLLAKFKLPQDIPLFVKAKQANFDTHCGFDIEFIFWALEEKTKYYLQENHPDLFADSVEAYLAFEQFDILQKWWVDQQKKFPDNIELEDTIVLYERNLYLENLEEAKALLDNWAITEPESERKSSYLKYHYQQLGETGKSIDIVENQLKLKERGKERASCYRELIELYTLHGAPVETLDIIEKTNLEFQLFEEWKKLGLGHMTIKAVFEFVLVCDDTKVATKAFKIACAWCEEVDRLPHNTIQAGQQAAERCDR